MHERDWLYQSIFKVDLIKNMSRTMVFPCLFLTMQSIPSSGGSNFGALNRPQKRIYPSHSIIREVVIIFLVIVSLD